MIALSSTTRMDSCMVNYVEKRTRTHDAVVNNDQPNKRGYANARRSTASMYFPAEGFWPDTDTHRLENPAILAKDRGVAIAISPNAQIAIQIQTDKLPRNLRASIVTSSYIFRSSLMPRAQSMEEKPTGSRRIGGRPTRAKTVATTNVLCLTNHEDFKRRIAHYSH